LGCVTGGFLFDTQVDKLLVNGMQVMAEEVGGRVRFWRRRKQGREVLLVRIATCAQLFYN